MKGRASERARRPSGSTHPDVHDLGVARGRRHDRELLGLEHGEERTRSLSMAEHWSQSSGREATCYHSGDMDKVTLRSLALQHNTFSALYFFPPFMSMYHSRESKENHQDN